MGLGLHHSAVSNAAISSLRACMKTFWAHCYRGPQPERSAIHFGWHIRETADVSRLYAHVMIVHALQRTAQACRQPLGDF